MSKLKPINKEIKLKKNFVSYFRFTINIFLMKTDSKIDYFF